MITFGPVRFVRAARTLVRFGAELVSAIFYTADVDELSADANTVTADNG